MRQDGLTLLEMMVVLMIASMALTLGFQSLGQWRRADMAISGITGETRQMTLTRSWLEESLRSLTPVEPNIPGISAGLGSGDTAPPVFSGSPQKLSGLSLNGVLSDRGGSIVVAWEVIATDATLQLVLTENGQTLSLPLPGVTHAEFVYLDPEGRPHPEWPPRLGLADQLPRAVGLRLESDSEMGHERVWAAPIVGITQPIPRPFELHED